MRLFILSLLLGYSLSITAQSFTKLFNASQEMKHDLDSSLLLVNQALEILDSTDIHGWIQAKRWKHEVEFKTGLEPSILASSLDSVIRVCKRNEEHKQVCQILRDIGYYYRFHENYQKGESYYLRALNYGSKYQLSMEIAQANNSLGVAHYYMGNHILALQYYTAAMQEYVKIQDSTLLAKSYNNIAIIYKNQKNYEKAIEYYTRAIEIHMRIGGQKSILRNRYLNLTRAYWETFEYEKAEQSILRMVEIDMTYEDLTDYIISRLHYQDNLLRQGKLSEALAYSKMIEKESDSLGLDHIVPRIHFYRSWVFQDMGELDSALYYLNKSEAMSNVRLEASEYYRNKADVLLELKRPYEVIENARASLEIGLKANFKEWIFESYYYLYQAYKMLNDNKKALESFEQYQLYKDSLWNEDKSIEIGLLQNEVELNQVEAKNNLLEKEAQLRTQTIQSQHVVLIGSIIIVLLLITIAFLFKRQLEARKKLLRKIENQAEKLRELDRAKTQFFANISHDLRSPLTLILASLDKITERDSEILDNESKALLKTGYKNGKRLLYLADEIMDLTRLEEGKIQLEIQHVKIVPYLRLLTKMFSSAADIKSIELTFQSNTEEETTLQLDPHQFEKIVYNLLSNAIKFTPENGKVEVVLTREKDDVVIRVSDTGSGIPKDSISYIFDRYYQSSSNEFNAQAGVGIGLALVKELVELHRGSIQVESSPSGTTFVIHMPSKESDWVSKAIIPERSLDVVTRNSLWVDLQDEESRIQVPSIDNKDENAPTILIVEDHKELRSYLKSLLMAEYRVYQATNGITALDILQSEKIDLIITDLMMPYMDGFELIDQLKKDKELKRIPVLVISARTDRSEKLDLLTRGANEVLGKPFDKEELLARIQSVLNREWDNHELYELYEKSAPEFEKNIMVRLERLILKRIDDPHLSVLDLADEMAASERKVYRMIKKISGLTPYELIKEVRWQYLEKYLSENKIRTATEAAQRIGMRNVSTFSDQYSKRFGHSIKEMIE